MSPGRSPPAQDVPRLLRESTRGHSGHGGCGSAHFWARKIESLGHKVVLLPPTQVRPYVVRNKTDRTDTRGILEAHRNDDIRPVPVKTVEQQVLASLHRMRSAWVADRTAKINLLRGLRLPHLLTYFAGSCGDSHRERSCAVNRRWIMNGRTLSTLFAGVLIAVALVSPVASQDRERTAPASNLYARLGGYDFIAKFVDTAFPRVAGHTQLSRLFQGHSKDSQLRQRQLIVDALCQATGGPCAYTGRAMKPVHAGLGITDADWAVFVGILKAALEELKVAPSEREDFLDLLVLRFRPDVVETR